MSAGSNEPQLNQVAELVVQDVVARGASRQNKFSDIAPFFAHGKIPGDYVADRQIVVVGSANADICLEIHRMPQEGECLPCAPQRDETGKNLGFVPGGKGANQAVCCQLLQEGNSPNVHFIGSFGTDITMSPHLKGAISETGVITQHSGTSDCPCGQAYIFIDPAGGSSILLMGGANTKFCPLTDEAKS